MLLELRISSSSRIDSSARSKSNCVESHKDLCSLEIFGIGNPYGVTLYYKLPAGFPILNY